MTGTFYKYFVILVIVLIASGKLFSQEEEIKAKQGQLSSIKDEITSLETELKSKTRKEKESFSAIENYSRQSFLLNKLIGSYRTEEKQKEAKICESQQKISQLEDEIKQLQKNYAKYIKAAYMHGQPDELEMVVDAASVQQALLRLKYLEKFSEQRTKDIAKLKESKEQLIVEKEILKKEKEAKAQLAAA